MKKVLAVLLSFIVVASVNAQISTYWTNAKQLDTVTNTGTRIMYADGGLTYISTKASHTQFSATVKVLKISGTVAGKIYWETSDDGSNFHTIDSVTVTDLATATYAYHRSVPSPFVWFRARQVGSGTMAASVAGTYFIRRQ